MWKNPLLTNKLNATTRFLQFFYVFTIEVRKSINGRLINTVRINPEIYHHLENFIFNENLNHILTWKIQEQMLLEANGIFHRIPLYIPVKPTEPAGPSEEHGYLQLVETLAKHNRVVSFP